MYLANLCWSTNGAVFLKHCPNFLPGRLYLFPVYMAPAPLWKRAPLLRLLPPFCLGIISQWYWQLSALYLLVPAVGGFFIIFSFGWLPIGLRFRLKFLSGLAVHLLFFGLGGLLSIQQNITNNPQWLGKIERYDAVLLVVGEEPIERTQSFKAEAKVEAVYKNRERIAATGKVLLYFREGSAAGIHYGTQILVRDSLPLIKNAGNPGGFDFQQYSLFNGRTHQRWLNKADFTVLLQAKKEWLQALLYDVREWVLKMLRTYIPGKRRQSLAEALLIGYKAHLEQDLVQMYSNTGVVHIIAISGMHIGFIYLLLLFITKPLQRKQTAWLRMLLIIVVLWLFSLLAGGQPSVLRSAVMFTIIGTGSVLSRNSNIYNTLALSAFVLLCINPFWLWDVGFQLSYAAVLSIILFYKPIYNLFYFRYKAFDYLWGTAAVSVAAQILTMPLSIYHFHQFPVVFFIANVVAVPLSTFALAGAALICLCSPLPVAASFMGVVTTTLIDGLNWFVAQLNAWSFAIWNSLYLSILQTVLLYLIIAGIALWLQLRKQSYFVAAGVSMLLFTGLRTASFLQSGSQRRLIVYNISKHTAIDIFQGRNVYFLGDDNLLADGFLRNFHLQPSRIKHRMQSLEVWPNPNFSIWGKNVSVLNDSTAKLPSTTIHLLVVTHKTNVDLQRLFKEHKPHRVVIDSSVPYYQKNLWMKAAVAAGVPCHSTTDSGAFVWEL